MKLFVVLIGSLFVVAYGLQSKAKCDYTHESKSYKCKYITHKFPPSYYGNYNLRCDSCLIHEFNNETFVHDNTLISFNLTNSGVRSIGNNSFHALKSLQFIDFRYNNIYNISPDAFKGLRTVYEMYLDHNQLTNLTPGMFNEFEANLISLTNNKLTEIPNDVFQGMYGAMVLDLSHNKLHTLYPDSFKHFRGMEYLSLAYNNLCNIPLGTLSRLISLKHLNLAGNRIKHFNYGVLSGMPFLSMLNVSYNSLTDFDGTALLPLTALTTLDISANGLNFLDGVSIHANSPTLRRIAIADNLWVCNSLATLVRYLRTVFIEVIESDKYEVPNLHGVACIENYLTEEKIPFQTFMKMTKEQAAFAHDYC